MNVKLYRSVFVLLIIMLVMVISPLASAQEEGASITLVLSLEPTTLDPQGTPHPSHAVMLPFIYDSLVFQDAQGNIHPFLAESWEIADDGMTLTFNLSSDVFFSNGTGTNKGDNQYNNYQCCGSAQADKNFFFVFGQYSQYLLNKFLKGIFSEMFTFFSFHLIYLISRRV